jgi:hypothetical protein
MRVRSLPWARTTTVRRSATQARSPHKWWRERAKPGSALLEQHARYLAHFNATAAVPIETADMDHGRRARAADGGSPGNASIGERFLDAGHRQQYDRFVNEEHHRQYGTGSAWVLGKYVFESVVSAGLRPEHRLLDFACGALRFGTWVIAYLDEGNYFGVDSHLPSLEAGAAYEIPLRGLEQKHPRLLWNEDLAVPHFSTTFDWIVDHHGTRRLKPKDMRPVAYARLAEVLNPGGVLLTAPEPAAPIEALAESGLMLSRQWTKDCPLLAGTSFQSTITWWEFVRE